MAMAKAIGKSEVYIPEEILKKLKIKVGDKLDVDVRKNGDLILHPRGKGVVDEAFGIWADRVDIDDSTEYVRKIRRGWKKRTESIDGE